MSHWTWSTRNDYEQKINYDWPYNHGGKSKNGREHDRDKRS